MAQFAHNNLVTEPLRVSFFKANYGFNLDFVVFKAPGPWTKVVTLQEVQVFINKLRVSTKPSSWKWGMSRLLKQSLLIGQDYRDQASTLVTWCGFPEAHINDLTLKQVGPPPTRQV